MIELEILENYKDEVIRRLNNRNIIDYSELVNSAIKLEKKRKSLAKEICDISRGINLLNDEIYSLKKENKDTSELIEYLKERKKYLSECSTNLKNIEIDIKKTLSNIRNIPYKSVPVGGSSKENIVVYQTEIDEKLIKKPHYELIKEFNIIDFDLGIKLTGAGFPVYKGKGAKIQRALVNFFLDEVTNSGYVEHEIPIVLNEDSFFATGQLPDKENQMYRVDDNFFLIPTAEVPLTNLYRNVIVEEDSLPIKLTGYSPCFRREAGSWGKDVRGLNRLHQFDKVEIVQIVKPEESYFTLETMRIVVEKIVKKLELPYRILKLCTGDLGFNSAFTYDLEVYSVGQDKWLEASSISNFETYQSNRLNLKYRNTVSGEKILLHTLNGSALALPRILAAILEWNYDGEKIIIPQVLRKYTNFDLIEKF